MRAKPSASSPWPDALLRIGAPEYHACQVSQLGTAVGNVTSLPDKDMSKPILGDDLRTVIKRLLTRPKAWCTRYPGRKPFNDRAVFKHILCVPQTTCAGPAARGTSRASTRGRRTRSAYPASPPTPLQSARVGPGQKEDPIDRERPGSEHYHTNEAQGFSLVVILHGPSPHDATQIHVLLDAIPN
ncbi:hypothetical protein LMG29542_07707 [Paraburkholderia humisilvae]|uniref:Uncharacterized protein n=1 Tax=Paraburkholderia humisilvae TaxID=627669 RepID=A0A6J5F9J5_9BURK|nr:hypothetical protein LMG29542_07707 [Paraburkholderia humisilvae]